MVACLWRGGNVPPRCGGVPLWVSGRGVVRRDGQGVVAGGPQSLSNNAAQWCCQGQPSGRWRVILRADDAVRAATLISLRRIVAVVALASWPPARVAAARVRLNAITARTSQAAFAANNPEGRCARAEFFRSALTCSMTACPRWVLSAATVSSTAGSGGVEKGWDRQTSKSGA